MKFTTIGAFCAALALAACNGAGPDAAAPQAETAAPDAGALLDGAIAGDQRTAEDRARDAWRHPKETLEFFGVEPSMTVVEIWPGGGWYAKILASYLKAGGGVYYAAHVDPAASERAAERVAQFKSDFSDAETYGDVRVTALGAGDIAPAGSADVVLTFRNVHNWLGADKEQEYFNDFYKALKPGGVLGVVEHRADEDADDKDGSSGYVKESTVKARAAAAGFEFVGASEINANPADTKDHPYGVWTLPPVRRSAPSSGQADPDFDRAKYDAIGESDRMTLKFVKPAE
ncbi:MAG TPA: methyltransferase domain-containing protein [Parvularculaceae bacterium]|nr:methyltransferase domain-containing protein [Parvularculaceae bacterium]